MYCTKLRLYYLFCDFQKPMSFIYPNDKIYVNEEVFTESELDEIQKYKLKQMPQMPQDLLTYLNSFRVVGSFIYLVDNSIMIIYLLVHPESVRHLKP